MGDQITLLVLGALAGAALLGGGVGIFNSLIQVKNNLEKAFANIDVLLQQRHDELPKLIDTCKAFMQHERGLLLELTELRAGYRRSADPDEKIRIENQIQRDLEKLRVSLEAYPQLASSQSFLHVHDRVASLESAIADRREFFNDSVNVYNIQIEQLPHMVLARLLGYARRPMLDVPLEARRDVEMTFA